jgi:hypothetical protein
MKGITLSRMSRPETPGLRPAPEIAWSEVITTDSSPKLRATGARAIASPVVVQFGMGAT